jgi:serine/threonine protein kinase
MVTFMNTLRAVLPGISEPELRTAWKEERERQKEERERQERKEERQERKEERERQEAKEERKVQARLVIENLSNDVLSADAKAVVCHAFDTDATLVSQVLAAGEHNWASIHAVAIPVSTPLLARAVLSSSPHVVISKGQAKQKLREWDDACRRGLPEFWRDALAPQWSNAVDASVNLMSQWPSTLSEDTFQVMFGNPFFVALFASLKLHNEAFRLRFFDTHRFVVLSSRFSDDCMPDGVASVEASRFCVSEALSPDCDFGFARVHFLIDFKRESFVDSQLGIQSFKYMAAAMHCDSLRRFLMQVFVAPRLIAFHWFDSLDSIYSRRFDLNTSDQRRAAVTFLFQFLLHPKLLAPEVYPHSSCLHFLSMTKDCLGRGLNGVVYSLRAPFENVVLKVYGGENAQSARENEMSILKTIQGHSVAGVIAIWERVPSLRQATRSMEQSRHELHALEQADNCLLLTPRGFKRIADGVSIPDIVRAFIVTTLRSLHQTARVLHCDIRPANILFANGGLLLIDFTAAHVADEGETGFKFESPLAIELSPVTLSDRLYSLRETATVDRLESGMFTFADDLISFVRSLLMMFHDDVNRRVVECYVATKGSTVAESTRAKTFRQLWSTIMSDRREWEAAQMLAAETNYVGLADCLATLVAGAKKLRL